MGRFGIPCILANYKNFGMIPKKQNDSRLRSRREVVIIYPDLPGDCGGTPRSPRFASHLSFFRGWPGQPAVDGPWWPMETSMIYLSNIFKDVDFHWFSVVILVYWVILPWNWFECSVETPAVIKLQGGHFWTFSRCQSGSHTSYFPTWHGASNKGGPRAPWIGWSCRHVQHAFRDSQSWPNM